MALRNRHQTGGKRIRSSGISETQISVERRLAIRKRAADSALNAVTFKKLRSVADALSRLWRDLAVTPNYFAPGHEDHSHRVALFSLRIARLMGLGQEQAERILRAAYLHDVGAIGVPVTIAHTHRHLAAQERKAMQVHSQISCQMLGAFQSTRDLAGIALSHHERFDGDGYPNGIQGAKIPLEARVLTIADSLDAMISRRPYRGAVPVSVALDELAREAGHQFDPNIVDVIVREGEAIASCPIPPSASK